MTKIPKGFIEVSTNCKTVDGRKYEIKECIQISQIVSVMRSLDGDCYIRTIIDSSCVLESYEEILQMIAEQQLEI